MVLEDSVASKWQLRWKDISTYQYSKCVSLIWISSQRNYMVAYISFSSRRTLHPGLCFLCLPRYCYVGSLDGMADKIVNGICDFTQRFASNETFWCIYPCSRNHLFPSSAGAVQNKGASGSKISIYMFEVKMCWIFGALCVWCYLVTSYVLYSTQSRKLSFYALVGFQSTRKMVMSPRTWGGL